MQRSSKLSMLCREGGVPEGALKEHCCDAVHRGACNLTQGGCKACWLQPNICARDIRQDGKRVCHCMMRQGLDGREAFRANPSSGLSRWGEVSVGSDFVTEQLNIEGCLSLHPSTVSRACK